MLSIKVCVLASGSKGNCVYLENKNDKFLIDAGISALRIKKSLATINRDIEDINAVFVTHEHSDHVRGVGVLTRRYNIPVYINKPTFDAIKHRLGKINQDNFIFIGNSNTNKNPNYCLPYKSSSSKNNSITEFSVGNTLVKAVSKSHDAVLPLNFMFASARKSFSVITDLGIADDNTALLLQESTAAAVEFNHDIDMLFNGPYPWPLKHRINSSLGHLSNFDAANLVLNNGDTLKHLFFSHISENNNTHDKVMQTFNALIADKNSKFKNINAFLTYQDIPTAYVRI